MKNKIFKKVAIGAGIILGVLVCAFIILWLWGIGKFVDAKYGKPPAKEKLEKMSQIAQSFVNTELLKNAPACNAPEVTEGVYNILQENYLVDGESTVRRIEVGGEEGMRNIVGKLSYSYLNLYGITLEKVDKEAKKNACAGTLTYMETLNEDGAMGEDRKLVYTNYSCHISYETQKTLDSDDIQVGIMGKECKKLDSSVEENDD